MNGEMWGAAAILIMCVVIGFLFGMGIESSNLHGDCKDFGKLKLGGAVYSCVRDGVAD